MASTHTLQAPTGLRDFYPQDLLRRRYIEKLWRDTSIRHGFEEIDGPTFEHAELYKIKSGEGILNEMFGVFSGKDESQRAALAAGEAPYALRPEFTPTLARLYAAKAATLPKPCKWFWQQNCYRAEKPQRGRLREFMQWNCDVIGGDQGDVLHDGDVIACVVGCLDIAGLHPVDARVHVCHKFATAGLLEGFGVAPTSMGDALSLLDRRGKIPEGEFLGGLVKLGLKEQFTATLDRVLRGPLTNGPADLHSTLEHVATMLNWSIDDLQTYWKNFQTDYDVQGWLVYDLGIVRGLAYYTGMVFEVIAEGERAIAGGGRYDNLIELFGGPATPAVGFGMGDVVLSLLLADKGLMPEGKDLFEALSAPAASFRPDAFVISNGIPEADAAVRPLVAKLRRGTESGAWLAREGRKPWDAARYRSVGEDDLAARPLHARHTYKTTKNIGKLLKEASDQHARAAVIIESGQHATVRNLETREERKEIALERVPGVVAGLVAG